MQPVETALDLALIVMKNGGSTSGADRTFQNVLKGYEQSGISAEWRMDFVAACGAANGQFSTVIRPVGAVAVNLARASEATVLGDRVARGEVSAAALTTEIARIEAIAPPYGRWAMVVAAASAAAAFSKLTGGDWEAFGIASVAASIGQLFRSLLQAKKLAVGPVTLICGVLSACIAGAGLRLGLSQTAPSALVSSIIYMVPGLPLINGFVDVVSQRYLLVGLERIAYASYLFLVLAIALAFAITAFS